METTVTKEGVSHRKLKQQQMQIMEKMFIFYTVTHHASCVDGGLRSQITPTTIFTKDSLQNASSYIQHTPFFWHCNLAKRCVLYVGDYIQAIFQDNSQWCRKKSSWHKAHNVGWNDHNDVGLVIQENPLQNFTPFLPNFPQCLLRGRQARVLERVRTLGQRYPCIV